MERLIFKPRTPKVIKKLTEPRCLKCGSQLMQIQNGYKCADPNCDWVVVVKKTKAGKLKVILLKLNNNKTLITGTLWLAAAIAFPAASIPINIVGGALTGTSVAHKGSKAVNKSKNKAEEDANKWDEIIRFIINILKSLKKGGRNVELD